MGLIRQKSVQELFPQYTEKEKEELKKHYTPAQMAAIEAGEAAVNPEDLKRRGVIRSDMGALPYFDDFSKTRALLDRVQPYEGPLDPNPRLMDVDEFQKDVDRAFAEVKKTHVPPELKEGQDEDDPEYVAKLFPSRLDLWKMQDQLSGLMGSDGKHIPVHHNTSLLAPRIPVDILSARDPGEPGEQLSEEEKKEAEIEAKEEAKQAARDRALEREESKEPDPRDPDGLYNRLIKQTGMTLDEIFELRIKILVRHRVVNQTRLGKIASQYCLAVAGDGKGRLGIGQAKGQEGEDTYVNARISAILAMQPVPRYENRTIYGDVEGKQSAVVVKLMARPPGFGLRCQHLIFEMARAAGIQDLAARVPRSRNPMNTVKAAYKALMQQRIPDEIARARGKKLVDVRKVYYGGKV